MLRRELGRWNDRAIDTITKRDVIEVIDAVVKRGSPSTAHHLFAYMRRAFNYAVARDVCEHSPCDRLKPSVLIGPKGLRQRVLTDDEIRALWSACDVLGYPYGRLYQLLLVTGQRRGEVSGARWREFDLQARQWTVPPERFKSNATHLVPLSAMAIDILKALPRKGDHLFVVNGFSPLKRRLDKLMQCDPFVIHDLRRTVRTRMSGLRIKTEVAEMVIGHGKRGLARIYDQHEYFDEMREALDAWAKALSAIVASAR
jgi:integrase